MVELPCGERLKLSQARAKTVEAVALRIKELLVGLERKEELLAGYEMDLAKLRQAEFLLEKKSEQLDENHVSFGGFLRFWEVPNYSFELNVCPSVLIKFFFYINFVRFRTILFEWVCKKNINKKSIT